MKVVDLSEKRYVRAFSWFKLLKLWAALRWDDTMGIPPSSVQMLPGRGLRGKILRSKTTGEGRRVDVQEFYVANGCWLLAERWLEVGWSLFMVERGETSCSLARTGDWMGSAEPWFAMLMQ